MVTAWATATLTSLAAGLASYEAAEGTPPGLHGDRRDPFLRQLLDSMRRNRYVDLLLHRDLAAQSTDPTDQIRFDPLKAAIIFKDAGEKEEALWMVFLYTHFGKNLRGGWEYARKVYLGDSNGYWTWDRVTEGIEEFRDWLEQHHKAIAAERGGFGNHRKRESLSGRSEKGTGTVVATYIDWAGSPPSQYARIADAITQAQNNPAAAFAVLDKSLEVAVQRFGRLARFDYLSMIGKLGLADIRPGHAYLKGSTGPLNGAREMFGPTTHRPAAQWYEQQVAAMAAHLEVGFDVMEDALCNWQKSPNEIKRFRG
jgi:hypothetical protein